MNTLLFTLRLMSTPPRGQITPVVQRGTTQSTIAGTARLLTTGPGSALKVIYDGTTVITLGAESALRIHADGSLELTAGNLTLALPSGRTQILRHGPLRFTLHPGVSRVALGEKANFRLAPRQPEAVAPALPAVKARKKALPRSKKSTKPMVQEPPPVKKAAPAFRLTRDLCMAQGSLTLQGTKEPLCHPGSKRCFLTLKAGTCLNAAEIEEEPDPVLFLPLMEFVSKPLDFIALIPSLNRSLSGSSKSGGSSESAAGAGGGSMCLDASGSGGGAGDVGQSNQQSVKPVPLSRVTLRLTFGR